MTRAEILANTLLTAKNNLAYIPVSRYLMLVLVLVHVFILAVAILTLTTLQQLSITTLLLLIEGSLA
ncbi:hypothetical protein C1Y03_30945, partial [Pseudomonas sp. FW306-02-H05-AA]